ncbi:hypothetical protein PPERSA_05696 [Pseudocohnilembus persalinus]|uniref:Uncharacterized protein n=1 Tax=Pseudocohnilembus persalinus TaxID=266149 RepID=A0A0V0QMD9_PSEPJ|nr:hypothetical protein PPERSA_05696 [Pseudocohnilembus persalinus]|eukprot:KRX03338.1 hypothetical protein PPERSA_05696 [Pseudocohnilembus persalinus]
MNKRKFNQVYQLSDSDDEDHKLRIEEDILEQDKSLLLKIDMNFYRILQKKINSKSQKISVNLTTEQHQDNKLQNFIEINEDGQKLFKFEIYDPKQVFQEENIGVRYSLMRLQDQKQGTIQSVELKQWFEYLAELIPKDITKKVKTANIITQKVNYEYLEEMISDTSFDSAEYYQNDKQQNQNNQNDEQQDILDILRKICPEKEDQYVLYNFERHLINIQYNVKVLIEPNITLFTFQ